MSSKDQYKDYARRYKANAEKLKRTIELKTKIIETQKIAIKQLNDVNFAARQEIRELNLKISKMQFWRDLFGIKQK